jgi:hypothetical protein
MKKALVRMVSGFAVVMILGGHVAAEKRFELGAGIASPVGNFQDNWNTGLGLNGALLMEITPFVSGGFSASYSTLGFDTDVAKAARARAAAQDPAKFTASGGDASIISLCGELRAQTGAMDKAVFYGGAGMGLYVVSISNIISGDPSALNGTPGAMKTETFKTKNRFGGFANAGFAIPVSSMIRIGARAQYNIYWAHEGGGESVIVSSGDATSSFLAVQALVMVSLGG